MSDASKRQLLTSLAELLGFDDAGDACEDVLKHLLTIESQLVRWRECVCESTVFGSVSGVVLQWLRRMLYVF
jgi:hypothetical protein